MGCVDRYYMDAKLRHKKFSNRQIYIGGKYQEIFAVLFFILLFTSFLQAEETNRKFAIGMPPAFENIGNQISIKYFFKNFGLQTNFHYNNNTNENEFFTSTKKEYNTEIRILKKLQSKKNIYTYTGFGYLYGKEKEKDISKSDSYESFTNTISHQTSIYLGVEYFFKEIKNLGFSAEIGYAIKNKKIGTDTGSTSKEKNSFFFSSLWGLHYYLK